MKKTVIAAIAVSSLFAGAAHAQGLVGGAQQGVAQGNAAAGPLGGIVGGAVGAATGTVGGVFGGDPLGVGGPGYGAPGYAAQGYGAPGYGAPGYGGPGYSTASNGGLLGGGGLLGTGLGGGGGLLGTGLLGTGGTLDMPPDLRTFVASEGIPSYNYRGNVRIGTVLPRRGVTYYVTPATYGTPLNHTIVNGQVVLTEPHTHRVVQIVG